MKLSTLNNIIGWYWKIWRVIVLVLSIALLTFLILEISNHRIIIREIKVPVEVKKEVIKETIKPCDENCAIDILLKSKDNFWIGTAIDQKWIFERQFLSKMNCGNLPSPHPKIDCENDYKLNGEF